jgi:uncharacterized protein with beta-barrel porin domain
MSAVGAALRRDGVRACVARGATRFQPGRFLLRLALLAAASTLPSAAFAGCSPATGDNVTVSCSSATLNQGPGPNTGYGDGSQTGLTINVQAGPPPASVIGTSVGIGVGDNNIINNLGTISTQGTGGIGDLFGINANANLTVNNSGTIGRLDIVNNVFDAAGINAGPGLAVTNNFGATIQGTFGIQALGNATVVNSGLITGLTGGGGGEGIDSLATPSQLNVTNNATGVITGDAAGINAVSAVVFNSGTISAPGLGGIGVNANTLVLTNFASGLITGDGFGVSGSQTPTLTITNLGTISSTGLGGVAVEGNTVTLVNSGSISSATGSGGQAVNLASGSITNNAGGTISGDVGILASGNTSIFNAGTITGNGGTAITFFGGGNTLTLAPGSVINGTAQGFGADTFQLGGTGTASFDASLLLTQYSGYATFNKVDASTWMLTGTNATAMPWNVNAGTLEVDGTLVNATMTVNAGGTLAGTGTVGSVTVNGGGTLAAGSAANRTGALAVSGNVTFNPASIYLVTINGSANSAVSATGSATLSGAAQVAVASGSAITVGHTYTILTASGGVNGTFDPNVRFGAFQGTLKYDADDVFLTFSLVKLAPLLPPGAPIDIVDVAKAIDAFGGTLPGGFLGLLSLSPAQIENALGQLSGELGTGAQLAGFQLMDQFMLLLLDPLADGHGAGIGPLPFAPAGQPATFTPEVANAYASVLKAPAAPITAYGPWRAWGAAYGGTNSITGDPVVTGSHDVRTTAGGFAAGLDYRVSPDTVLGIALAGAATGWDVSAGLGSGHSDAFQAGAYAKHQFGEAYVAGALAFANYWASTTRTVTVAGADTLKADFDAQSFGGRLEGGWRLHPLAAAITVTPYAAIQAQSFRLPGYSETAASGSPQFALSYAGQTSTATRAELGSWLARNVQLASGDTAVLFGRVAWAHDRFGNLAVTPSFLALPGASFIVDGAVPPADLALITAGAEWRSRGNWSVMGRFDGEFGNGQQTYTGTARVRYAW